MPELLLRGSLANVTMANLTESERERVSDVMVKVSDNSEIKRHKNKFVTELGNTISADYRDDRSIAEEEFNIAIWRATVSLLYHRKYTFKCIACDASSYDTRKGRQIMMDRQYPVCPNCNQVLIIDPGDTKFSKGQYVDNQIFQDSYKDFTERQASPKCTTPITPIAGERAYNNPDAVLTDDRQLVKFFTEFVWNYFRQILKENGRVEHKKKPQTISDRADRIIVQEIISVCDSYKLSYNYCNKTQPELGKYHIRIGTNRTPPEVTSEFIAILEKAKANGVVVEFDEDNIKVLVNTAAPYITADVIKPEHVIMTENGSHSGSDNENDQFEISDITDDRRDTMREDHTAMIEAEDAITAVRRSLPNEECRKIFDIWSCRGDSYRGFSDQYGDNKACINHIAQFMGITPRAVKNHKETIKINMLACGMVPSAK
jgi:hypothetical protein